MVLEWFLSISINNYVDLTRKRLSSNLAGIRSGNFDKKKPGYLPGLLILWWALRDSNPEPRDYESPALTVAPRALVISGYKGNEGLPFREALHHVVKYYHARGARSTHDLVDQEDHGAAFGLIGQNVCPDRTSVSIH